MRLLKRTPGSIVLDEASPADLVSAVRRGVESGTIKGERRWWCDRERRMFTAKWCDHHEPLNCGYRLILPPVSDGGSET